jgi:CBS domain containing-hemolysin-like protein
MTTLLLQLLLQALLILLNAIFACAEIAILSVNKPKMSVLAEKGDRKARRLVRMTDAPARFLATIQVAITLSGFLGSAFAADNFAEKLSAFLAARLSISAAGAGFSITDTPASCAVFAAKVVTSIFSSSCSNKISNLVISSLSQSRSLISRS